MAGAVGAGVAIAYGLVMLAGRFGLKTKYMVVPMSKINQYLDKGTLIGTMTRAASRAKPLWKDFFTKDKSGKISRLKTNVKVVGAPGWNKTFRETLGNPEVAGLLRQFWAGKINRKAVYGSLAAMTIAPDMINVLLDMKEDPEWKPNPGIGFLGSSSLGPRPIEAVQPEEIEVEHLDPPFIQHLRELLPEILSGYKWNDPGSTPEGFYSPPSGDGKPIWRGISEATYRRDEDGNLVRVTDADRRTEERKLIGEEAVSEARFTKEDETRIANTLARQGGSFLQDPSQFNKEDLVTLGVGKSGFLPRGAWKNWFAKEQEKGFLPSEPSLLDRLKISDKEQEEMPDTQRSRLKKGGSVKKKKKSTKKKVQRKITKTYANNTRKPKRA